MSHFKTTIPIDLDAIKALLPTPATIESVKWNGKEAELHWHTGAVKTPFTFPVEWSVDDLKGKRLPPGATEVLATTPQPVVPPPPGPTKKLVDKVRGLGRKGKLTE